MISLVIFISLTNTTKLLDPTTTLYSTKASRDAIWLSTHIDAPTQVMS